MFTKEDYVEYFEQIASVERMMIYRSHDVFLKIDDEEIKSPMNVMVEDENRHYGLVLGVFNDILMADEDDRRVFKREHFLGKVTLKINDSPATAEAYCVNISEGGVCIEFDCHIDENDDVEMWIDFFDGRESQHHRGQLVWSTKIPQDMQMGRITTKAGVDFLNE